MNYLFSSGMCFVRESRAIKHTYTLPEGQFPQFYHILLFLIFDFDYIHLWNDYYESIFEFHLVNHSIRGSSFTGKKTGRRWKFETMRMEMRKQYDPVSWISALLRFVPSIIFFRNYMNYSQSFWEYVWYRIAKHCDCVKMKKTRTNNLPRIAKVILMLTQSCVIWFQMFWFHWILCVEKTWRLLHI